MAYRVEAPDRRNETLRIPDCAVTERQVPRATPDRYRPLAHDLAGSRIELADHAVVRGSEPDVPGIVRQDEGGLIAGNVRERIQANGVGSRCDLADLTRRSCRRARWRKVTSWLGDPQIALPIERRSPRIASAFVQTVPLDARSRRFWLSRRRDLGCLTVTPAIRGDGRRTVSGVHEQNERQHHNAE